MWIRQRRSWMRQLLACCAAAALMTVSAGVRHAAAGPRFVAIAIPIEGEGGRQAKGYAAFPDGEFTKLVVVAHGIGHTAREWKPTLLEIAARGAVAVAMDYSTTFVGVARGAQETLAAARFFKARYPEIGTTYLLSVSLGSIPGGMAVADSTGVFDYWVTVEGLSNLSETWAEARAIGALCVDPIESDLACFARGVADDIETETGGTPSTAPLEYVRRSAALRGPDNPVTGIKGIASSGLKGAIVVHAVNDGLVPYNQGREMTAALAGISVPLDVYNVLYGTCPPRSNTPILPVADPICLAGHGSETVPDHVVIRTGLNALYALLSGACTPQGYREFTVADGTVTPLCT